LLKGKVWTKKKASKSILFDCEKMRAETGKGKFISE